VGALAGSAAMGSYQIIQAHAHIAALSEHLVASDPQVLERMRGGAGAVGSLVSDPLLRGAEGTALLSQSVAREASVLAFTDVFRLLGVLSLGTAVYVGYLLLLTTLRRSPPLQSGATHE
jgi:hypothetical protein